MAHRDFVATLYQHLAQRSGSGDALTVVSNLLGDRNVANVRFVNSLCELVELLNVPNFPTLVDELSTSTLPQWDFTRGLVTTDHNFEDDMVLRWTKCLAEKSLEAGIVVAARELSVVTNPLLHISFERTLKIGVVMWMHNCVINLAHLASAFKISDVSRVRDAILRRFSLATVQVRKSSHKRSLQEYLVSLDQTPMSLSSAIALILADVNKTHKCWAKPDASHIVERAKQRFGSLQLNRRQKCAVSAMIADALKLTDREARNARIFNYKMHLAKVDAICRKQKHVMQQLGHLIDQQTLKFGSLDESYIRDELLNDDPELARIILAKYDSNVSHSFIRILKNKNYRIDLDNIGKEWVHDLFVTVSETLKLVESTVKIEELSDEDRAKVKAVLGRFKKRVWEPTGLKTGPYRYREVLPSKLINTEGPITAEENQLLQEFAHIRAQSIFNCIRNEQSEYISKISLLHLDRLPQFHRRLGSSLATQHLPKIVTDYCTKRNIGVDK